MAKPITPTPPITGEDADALAASLQIIASPEEQCRRLLISQKRLAYIMTPLKDRKKNMRQNHLPKMSAYLDGVA